MDAFDQLAAPPPPVAPQASSAARSSTLDALDAFHAFQDVPAQPQPATGRRPSKQEQADSGRKLFNSLSGWDNSLLEPVASGGPAVATPSTAAADLASFDPFANKAAASAGPPARPAVQFDPFAPTPPPPAPAIPAPAPSLFDADGESERARRRSLQILHQEAIGRASAASAPSVEEASMMWGGSPVSLGVPSDEEHGEADSQTDEIEEEVRAADACDTQIAEDTMPKGSVLRTSRSSQMANDVQLKDIEIDAISEGMCLARISARSMLTKDWKVAFWVIEDDMLWLYRSRDDYYYHAKGKLAKKSLAITSHHRCTPINPKEYKNFGILHHFTLEEMSDTNDSKATAVCRFAVMPANAKSLAVLRAKLNRVITDARVRTRSSSLESNDPIAANVAAGSGPDGKAGGAGVRGKRRSSTLWQTLE